MSQVNRKLVFKTLSDDVFELVKSTNTLEFGVPGDNLDRKAVDKIISDHKNVRPGSRTLNVEFVGK